MYWERINLGLKETRMRVVKEMQKAAESQKRQVRQKAQRCKEMSRVHAEAVRNIKSAAAQNKDNSY